MNQKTNMLFVVNPGVFPAVTFVPCFDYNDREPVADAEPVQTSSVASRRESPTRNWTRAAFHLPKVVYRTVHETLLRKVARPGAAA